MTWLYEYRITHESDIEVYRIYDTSDSSYEGTICELWSGEWNNEELAKEICDSHNKKEEEKSYVGLGWICPVCGRGNAPFTSTCSCIPQSAPVITCERRL